MEVVDKMDSVYRQLLRLVSSIGLVFALASHSLTVNAEDELKFNQVEEINRLIHDYLMEHPEVILDSVQKHNGFLTILERKKCMDPNGF